MERFIRVAISPTQACIVDLRTNRVVATAETPGWATYMVNAMNGYDRLRAAVGGDEHPTDDPPPVELHPSRAKRTQSTNGDLAA